MGAEPARPAVRDAAPPSHARTRRTRRPPRPEPVGGPAIGGPHRPPHRTGRHRLGCDPALSHCRDLPAVRERLAQRRAAARRRRATRGTALALLLTVLALATAWYAATGVVVFAALINR
jgi:hypothetical protein